jgi:hypothetical protein
MDSEARPLSWSTELALATASGVLTAAIPVHRWSRRAQWSMHLSMGLLAGVGLVWLMQQREVVDDASDQGAVMPSEPEAPAGAATTALMALGGAAAMTAISVGGVAADRAAENALARRGIRHPRWWIGAAAGVFSLAAGLSDRRLRADDQPATR